MPSTCDLDASIATKRDYLAVGVRNLRGVNRATHAIMIIIIIISRRRIILEIFKDRWTKLLGTFVILATVRYYYYYTTAFPGRFRIRLDIWTIITDIQGYLECSKYLRY